MHTQADSDTDTDCGIEDFRSTVDCCAADLPRYQEGCQACLGSVTYEDEKLTCGDVTLYGRTADIVVDLRDWILGTDRLRVATRVDGLRAFLDYDRLIDAHERRSVDMPVDGLAHQSNRHHCVSAASALVNDIEFANSSLDRSRSGLGFTPSMMP